MSNASGQLTKGLSALSYDERLPAPLPGVSSDSQRARPITYLARGRVKRVH